jgi:rod shape-determining protein MreC
MAADPRVAIMPARVINNSLLFTDNYILIDKGHADGLRPGMGVLTPDGIVGRVKACSEHFATVYSFLHSDASASVMLAKNKAMATAKWMDSNYREATLLYLANHIEVKTGDTVVTTGFNSVYPRGLMVGTVSHVKREESEFFQDVRIRLSVDFSRIEYVYVYDDRRSRELEAIQADIQPKKKK